MCLNFGEVRLEHSSYKHEFEEMIAEAPDDTDLEICKENLQSDPKEPDYSDLIRATYSPKSEEKEEAHQSKSEEASSIKKPQEGP